MLIHAIVYGWDTASSSREELQTPYDIIVGYIKGHNPSSPTLVFMVNDIESERTGNQLCVNFSNNSHL